MGLFSLAEPLTGVVSKCGAVIILHLLSSAIYQGILYNSFTISTGVHLFTDLESKNVRNCGE